MIPSVSVQIVHGDAKSLPLPAESADLIVTSPPYFNLRRYTDNGEAVAGQLGSETTPADYIGALIDCTREWLRVLKPGGSIFVNLGDKYAAAPSGRRKLDEDGYRRDRSHSEVRQPARGAGVPAKSLMLLPERYRIAAVDELGLIARAVVVWSKPNGLPESVGDRVRRPHEDWVHLTREPRYFAALDNVREPCDPKTAARYALGYGTNSRTAAGQQSTPSVPLGVENLTPNPLGKLPGSVWSVATEPLRLPAHLGVNHFAAFPTEWPRRLILGWSPSGICTACGEGRRPAVEAHGQTPRQRLAASTGTERHDAAGGQGLDFKGGHNTWRTFTITGDVCACTPYTDHPGTGESIGDRPRREYHFEAWNPPATRPAVVLDPFGGTGTTALVAHLLGRHGVSVDLSADYCRVAAWRTSDPEHAEKLRRKWQRKGVGRG